MRTKLTEVLAFAVVLCELAALLWAWGYVDRMPPGVKPGAPLAGDTVTWWEPTPAEWPRCVH
jgi:hypothetical protein